MFNKDHLQQVCDHVSSARTILVLFSENATYDQVAVATSLYLSFKKLQKRVLIISSKELNDKFKKLAASDLVTEKMGNQNLHVVLNYSPEKVDKVRYHIDEDNKKFYLVIQPQRGYQPLDSEGVSFEYGGSEADLVFLVGVKDIHDLEYLYTEYKEIYQNATTISMNNFTAQVADINLDSSGSSCLSEATVPLLESLDIKFDEDIWTNLLAGIEEATDSFRSLVSTADTFFTVSKLMNWGARRINRKNVSSVQSQITTHKSENLKEVSKQIGKPKDVVSEVKIHQNKRKRKQKKLVGGLDYQPGQKRL